MVARTVNPSAGVSDAHAGYSPPQQLVNPYWLLPSFLAHCGRRVVETTGGRHLTLALLDMARQGVRRAFAKSASHKGGTWVVSLDGVRTVHDVTVALSLATGPGFLDLVGAPSTPGRGLRGSGAAALAGRIVLQEAVGFAFEYRFFVVDGRVVAGTASDRRATVLDAWGRGRLDPRVAALRDPPGKVASGSFDRGRTGTVEARRLVARMARALRDMLRAMRDDHVAVTFLDRAFTVDYGAIGADPDDAIVEPIEVNTFRNSGLYAVDYARVARALASRPSR